MSVNNEKELSSKDKHSSHIFDDIIHNIQNLKIATSSVDTFLHNVHLLTDNVVIEGIHTYSNAQQQSLIGRTHVNQVHELFNNFTNVVFATHSFSSTDLSILSTINDGMRLLSRLLVPSTLNSLWG